MNANKIFIPFFLGIILCAANSDHPAPIDECPEVKSTEDFNANLFFKGRWNVLKLFGWMPKGVNSCTRIEFLQQEKSSDIEMNYYSLNNKKVINNTFTWANKNSGELTYEGQHDYQTDSSSKSVPIHAKVRFFKNVLQ